MFHSHGGGGGDTKLVQLELAFQADGVAPMVFNLVHVPLLR